MVGFWCCCDEDEPDPDPVYTGAVHYDPTNSSYRGWDYYVSGWNTGYGNPAYYGPSGLQQDAQSVVNAWGFGGVAPNPVRFAWIPEGEATGGSYGTAGLVQGELWVANQPHSTILSMPAYKTDGYMYYSTGVNTQLFTAFSTPGSSYFGQNDVLNGMQLNANTTITSATLEWRVRRGHQTARPAYPTAYRYGTSFVNTPWAGSPINCTNSRVIRQRIWGESSTTSDFFTSSGQARTAVPNMTKTTAYVDVSFSFHSSKSMDSCGSFATNFMGTTSHQVVSINIKPIVDELVGLSGWGPTSKMRLIIEDNGTDSPSSGRRNSFAYPYSGLGATDSSKLTIVANGYAGSNRPYNNV